MHSTIVGIRAAIAAGGGASSGGPAGTGGAKILPDRGPGITVVPSRVEVPVPTGVTERLERLQNSPVGTIPNPNRSFELVNEVIECERFGSYRAGDATVRPIPMVHTGPGCGIRIESPSSSTAFTGDADRNEDLAGPPREVGICPAKASPAEPDHAVHGHLSVTEVGMVAAAGNARSVVPTHFPTSRTEWKRAHRADAAAVFNGPVPIGEPGMRYSVLSTGR